MNHVCASTTFCINSIVAFSTTKYNYDYVEKILDELGRDKSKYHMGVLNLQAYKDYLLAARSIA
jgi:hypothetical protein